MLMRCHTSVWLTWCFLATLSTAISSTVDASLGLGLGLGLELGLGLGLRSRVRFLRRAFFFISVDCGPWEDHLQHKSQPPQPSVKKIISKLTVLYLKFPRIMKRDWFIIPTPQNKVTEQQQYCCCCCCWVRYRW